MNERKIDPQFVENFYNKKAGEPSCNYEYERWGANELRMRDYRQAKETITYHLKDMNFADGLEVGCGPGTWTKIFIQHTQHLTALDISSAMIAQAKQNVTNDTVEWICADFQTTPPQGRQFDAFFSSRAIEYMEKEKALTNIVNLLKHNGKAYIITKNPFIIYRILGRCLTLGKNASDDLHIAQVSPHRLKRLCEEKGLCNLKVYPVIFDFYIPFMRFAIVRRAQRAVSDFLYRKLHNKQLFFIFLLWVESYLVIAEKK